MFRSSVVVVGPVDLWATRLRVVHKSTGLFCGICQRFAVQASTFWVDEAELDVGEANEPFPIIGLEDADRFTGEHLADKDQLTAPLDLAVRPHTAHGAVVVIDR